MGFFKHDRQEKKLSQTGRSAVAEILHVKTEGASESMRAMWADDDDLTTGWLYYRLKLKVMPDGEEPFEATVHQRSHGLLLVGEKLRVFYDPDDHGTVVVNTEGELKKNAVPMDGDALFEDVNAKMLKLDDLHARGMLTDDEYAAQQNKIIDEEL